MLESCMAPVIMVHGHPAWWQSPLLAYTLIDTSLVLPCQCAAMVGAVCWPAQPMMEMSRVLPCWWVHNFTPHMP